MTAVRLVDIMILVLILAVLGACLKRYLKYRRRLAQSPAEIQRVNEVRERCAELLKEWRTRDGIPMSDEDARCIDEWFEDNNEMSDGMMLVAMLYSDRCYWKAKATEEK